MSWSLPAAPSSASHGGSSKLSSGDDRLEIAGAAALIVPGMESGLSFATGSPGVLITLPVAVAGAAAGSSA